MNIKTQDVALRIYQKQWAIGKCGKRGPEISVLIARRDDDGICNVLFFKETSAFTINFECQLCQKILKQNNTNGIEY